MPACILMRGLPGSGKTTAARKIVRDRNLEPHQSRIFAADDYFCKDGVYRFDVSHAANSYAWNRQRAQAAFAKRVELIVIDSCNTTVYEMRDYARMADEKAYAIEICEMDTPWAWKLDELVRRNIHGMPRRSIERMMDRWEPNITVIDLLGRAPRCAGSAPLHQPTRASTDLRAHPEFVALTNLHQHALDNHRMQELLLHQKNVRECEALLMRLYNTNDRSAADAQVRRESLPRPVHAFQPLGRGNPVFQPMAKPQDEPLDSVARSLQKMTM